MASNRMAPEAAPSGSSGPRRNIDPLTSLRFFAAAYVLLFHSGAGFANKAGMPGFVVTFLTNGWFGVSVFFVLSGFILAYTYKDNIVSGQGVFDFAVARVARIYPVYLLALLVMFPLLPHGLSVVPALRTLALVQSWGPVESSQGTYWIMQAWSLSVEASFYLMFPFLVHAIWKLRRAATYGWLALVAGIMVGLATPQLRPGMAAPEFFGWLASVPLPVYRSLEFIFGILVCRLFFLPGAHRDPGSWKLAVVIAAMLALLASTSDPMALSVGSVLVGPLVYLLASVQGGIARFMSSRALVALGGASYAIYILHGPIREWVRATIASPTIGGLLNPVLVIAVSLMVFYWYEQPARTLVRMLAKTLEAWVKLRTFAKASRPGP